MTKEDLEIKRRNVFDTLTDIKIILSLDEQYIDELVSNNIELNEQIANLEGIKLAQETALNTEYNIKKQLKTENAKLNNINIELKEKLKDLISDMYHIAEHHPTMGAHTKIMQNLRETEQFLNDLKE